MQSMSHQIEEWPWRTPLMLRVESPCLSPNFEVNAGSRQRSSQVSAGYLYTKTVLFSLPPFECSRAHSSLYVYLSNVLQPKALKRTEWGQSRTTEMRPESNIYFWHCESLFKNICEQVGYHRDHRHKKITKCAAIQMHFRFQSLFV